MGSQLCYDDFIPNEAYTSTTNLQLDHFHSKTIPISLNFYNEYFCLYYRMVFFIE